MDHGIVGPPGRLFAWRRASLSHSVCLAPPLPSCRRGPSAAPRLAHVNKRNRRSRFASATPSLDEGREKRLSFDESVQWVTESLGSRGLSTWWGASLSHGVCLAPPLPSCRRGPSSAPRRAGLAGRMTVSTPASGEYFPFPQRTESIGQSRFSRFAARGYTSSRRQIRSRHDACPVLFRCTNSTTDDASHSPAQCTDSTKESRLSRPSSRDGVPLAKKERRFRLLT